MKIAALLGKPTQISVTRAMSMCATGALIGLAIAGYGLFTAAGTTTRTVPPEDVATVNRRPILRSDFTAQLEMETGKRMQDTSRDEQLKVLDEMVREANLHEMRDQFNDLRRMDIKGKILEAVDGDRTIRKTIADNPFDFKPAPPPVPVADLAPTAEIAPALGSATDFTAVPGLETTIVEARPEVVMGDPVIVDAVDELPAFIPPAIAADGPPKAKPPPPSFVPPAAVARLKQPQHAHPFV